MQEKIKKVMSEISGSVEPGAETGAETGVEPGAETGVEPGDELNGKPEIIIEENADMAGYTSFKAGGRAAALIKVSSVDALKAVLKELASHQIPHFFLGNGSNVLFWDEGYEGAVIKMQDFSDVAVNGTKVLCQTGIYMSSLARILLEHGLSGFEFASGIPGTLGGGLFMNAGAYGGELKDIVLSVRAVSPDGAEERIFSPEEMRFGYRSSILQESGFIAVEAELQLAEGSRSEIEDKMRELAAKRNAKQPVQFPSAGSTFKRPEGFFAGKLIEDAGLKGVSVGGAEVSTLHSGFIINRGGATATDILLLIDLVRNTVYDKFGVMLEPEVRII